MSETSTSLVNISVSYNRLTGTIPVSLQQSGITNVLDVSDNHFGGTLAYLNSSVLVQVDHNSNRNIKAESNRLSGTLSTSFINFPYSIDILAGNMFACSSNADLPQNDPDASNYVCGSSVLNSRMYIFAGLVAICVGLMYYHYMSPRFLDSLGAVGNVMSEYWRWSSDSTMNHHIIDRVALTLKNYRALCTLTAAMIVCILMPAYLILKQYYSTHEYQYGWIVSLGFMQYYPPAVTVAILWIMCLCVFEGYSQYLVRSQVVSVEEKGSNTSAANGSIPNPAVSRYLPITLLVFCNIIVSLVVNGSYVYLALEGSKLARLAATVTLIIFKLTWNFAFIVPRLDEYRCPFRVLLAVVVFNNILAPIFATLFVDVSCFQDIVIPPDPVVIPYSYVECGSISNLVIQLTKRCPHLDTITTSVTFNPPFIYSDQCASAIMQNYVPIYVVIIWIDWCCGPDDSACLGYVFLYS